MYIERILENKIKKYIKRKEIIAIVGSRQCGKTTLMKRIFEDLKNAKFISFDDQKILEIFEKDIEFFIKTYIEGIDFLFIDEFQYAKEGGKKLKYIYDNHNTKIILSGSSVAELSIHSIKHLVGRIFVFPLFPLSFDEFLNFKSNKLREVLKTGNVLSEQMITSVKKYYDEFVIFGGYPEVVLAEKNEEKIEILKNIYNTYLLREIREILQISDDFKFMKLTKALALQVGSEASYSELSLITSYSYNDIIKYVGILKKTYICIESRPFFSNKRKELVKMPKFFFLDNGFGNMCISNFLSIDERSDKGALNENFVATELFKKELNLNYWKTKSGAEVDFIVEKDGKVIPIEVKSLLKATNYGKSFINFLECYHSEKGIILSVNYFNNSQMKNSEILFRPIFMINYLI